jgi:hypothetical protein
MLKRHEQDDVKFLVDVNIPGGSGYTRLTEVPDNGRLEIPNIPSGRYYVFVMDKRDTLPPEGTGWGKYVVVDGGTVRVDIDTTIAKGHQR